MGVFYIQRRADNTKSLTVGHLCGEYRQGSLLGAEQQLTIKFQQVTPEKGNNIIRFKKTIGDSEIEKNRKYNRILLVRIIYLDLSRMEANSGVCAGLTLSGGLVVARVEGSGES